MSDALQKAPWAREKRRNALVAALQSIPADEIRAVLALAVCEAHGRKVAISLALGFEAAIQDAIEIGVGDA